MESSKLLNDLTTAVKNTVSILATKTTNAVENMKRDYELEQEKAYQTQMTLQYNQNAAYVNHDMSYVLQQVRTTIPLHAITTAYSLNFMPEMSTTPDLFVLKWQKRVLCPVSREEIEQLHAQINGKIRQVPFQLYSLGYINERFCLEFPFLYRGMVVENLINTSDGILMYVRVNL